MANGLLDKLGRLIGVEEEDPEEDIMYEDEEEEEIVSSPRKAAPLYSSAPPSPSIQEERGRLFAQPKSEPRGSKVLNIQNTSGSSMSSGKKPQQFKMVVTTPRSYDECTKLVGNLKNRKPVIINLETLPNDLAKRIFDFMLGAIYALDGKVQKVSEYIFIFAPENVDVMASIPEKAAKQGANMGKFSDIQPWDK